VTRSAFLEGAREAGGTKTCKGEVAKQKTALSQGAASLSLAVVRTKGEEGIQFPKDFAPISDLRV
jgi:hypothetical protein